MTNRKGRNSKNRVTNVRVVDEFAGTDGVRVDRMLASLHNSQSQCRVLCSTTFQITAPTTGVDRIDIFSGAQVRDTDDFVSLASQFELYRVVAIRFDVYDINPGLPAAHSFSTFHHKSVGNPTPFPFAEVVDAPDSQIVSPGTGVAHFTWVAKSTDERSFQTTITSTDSALAPPYNFGGLRWAVANTGSSIGTKFQVSAKALVDFRGRS